MLGKRGGCNTKGRLLFLLSSTSSRSRFFCASQIDGNILSRTENFEAATRKIFLQHKTHNNVSSAVISHLKNRQDTIKGENIACIYRFAADYGQSLNSSAVAEMLNIVQHDKKLVFTLDDIKDIFNGHRYFEDKDIGVRKFLQAVLASSKRSGVVFDCQRSVGLSVFGLQNMTAFYPETRNVLKTLSYHVECCPEPFDGLSVSAMLWGIRSMNSHENEVIRLVTRITKKLLAHDVVLSPAGVAQCLHSLQLKTDKKMEIVNLLAALNDKLRVVSCEMTPHEVCRSLNGLQAFLSPGPVVMTSFQLLREQFDALDARREVFTSKDLLIALGGFKGIGSPNHETASILKLIGRNLQKTCGVPCDAKDLVVGFSGLMHMKATQPGVSDIISVLTSHLLLLLKTTAAGGNMPVYVIPHVLRCVKKMNSDDISVKNLVSVCADTLIEYPKQFRLDAQEYTMCLSGLQNMKATDPSVRHFMSTLMKSFKLTSKNGQDLNWSDVLQILRGLLNMDSDSKEVQDILQLISSNMSRLRNSSGCKDQLIQNISSAMYGMRKMSSNSDQDVRNNVEVIYTGLFEKLKERCAAIAGLNQSVGKKSVLPAIGSISAIPASNIALSKDIMSYLVHLLENDNKRLASTKLYSSEIKYCLESISTRPHTCETADALLRIFLKSLGQESLEEMDSEIEDCMTKMKYPEKTIAAFIKELKDRTAVISEDEMDALLADALSLPQSLRDLRESIRTCKDGDSLDILWSRNLVVELDSHEAHKYALDDIACLLVTCCEMLLFFSKKNKNGVIFLRERLNSLSICVLKEAASTYTNSFEEFYTVFLSTERLWHTGGSLYGSQLLETVLHSFQQSTFELDVFDACKILRVLKQANSKHDHLDALLAILDERVDFSVQSDRKLSSIEFAHGVRAMRYMIYDSLPARRVFTKLLRHATDSGLELDFSDLAVASGSIKNSSCDFEECQSALLFFTSQLTNSKQTGEESINMAINLLSCVRFMPSSNEIVCTFIEGVDRLMSDKNSISMNQDVLCEFIQFLNYKKCSDSPVILKLRDLLIDLIDIGEERNKLVSSLFSQRVVEHFVALKVKGLNEETGSEEIFFSFARSLIRPENSRRKITPHMFCIGILGLDTLYEREGLESVATFCEKWSNCDDTFTFQHVMYALSTLEKCAALHGHADVMDLVLAPLTMQLLRVRNEDIKFTSMLRALRSVTDIGNSAMALFPLLTKLLAKESFNQTRVANMLEVVQRVDATRPEVQPLLELISSQLKDGRTSKSDTRSFLSMACSLENLDCKSGILKDISIELVAQFKASAPTERIRTVQDIKQLLERVEV